MPEKKSSNEKASESKDKKHVENILYLLERHGEDIKKHGLHYDALVTTYSTPDKQITVGEAIDDIHSKLETLLTKYLDVVGISGKDAAYYLHDLTLTKRALKQIFHGQLDRIITSEDLRVIHEQLRSAIRGKLRDIIEALAGNIENPETYGSLIEQLADKAGIIEERKKGLKDATKDYESFVASFRTIYEPLIGRLEEGALYKTEKKKKS